MWLALVGNAWQHSRANHMAPSEPSFGVLLVALTAVFFGVLLVLRRSE